MQGVMWLVDAIWTDEWDGYGRARAFSGLWPPETEKLRKTICGISSESQTHYREIDRERNSICSQG